MEKTDNEIIAEFMGLPLTKQLPQFSSVGPKKWTTVPFQRWKYHESWDWLMPVVVRCHELGDAEEQKFPEAKDLDDPTGWKAWSYRRVGLSTDINQVYTNVVNFIKWHNSQDTSNQPKKQ